MSANDSRGTPAHPTKDSRAHRGRDAREGAQNDGSDASPNNPPHGHVSHGLGYFLSQVDPETLPEEGWVEELRDRWERFQRDRSCEQGDLGRWSE